MATLRVLSGDWSLSQSMKSYFGCCLGSNKDGATDIITHDQVFGSDDEHATSENIANGEVRRASYGSLHSAKSVQNTKTSHKSLKSSFSLDDQESQKIEVSSLKSIKSNHTVRSGNRRTLGDGAEQFNTPPAELKSDSTKHSGERQEQLHVVPDKKNKGSAYSYDEQDTSSDSDDEVLRRYQQSIQRAPSQRSIHSTRSVHSTRSHKSSTSKSSHIQNGHQPPADDIPDPHEHLVSVSERGSVRDSLLDPTAHDDAASHVSKASGSQKSTSVKGAASVRISSPGDLTQREDIEGASSTHGGTVTGETQKQATYENEAFQKDLEASPEQASPTSTEQALSGYGDGSMSLGDGKQSQQVQIKEHLFDVSDLQDREPVLISKCGNLEVTFDYNASKSQMDVTVHKTQEIPAKDRGGANNTQVRLLLLPTKKVRHKTKVKPGENPEFNETFSMKVPSEEAPSMGLRFRLYGCERMRRERMIGEVVIGFASMNLESPTTHMLTLEPRSNLSHGDSKMDVSSLSRSDSASSTQSMQHGGMPELLIGLTYNGTTGRLSVEVIKGSNFKNMAMNRAPDTYVKLTLMSPNGQEIARSKTSIRRGQPNPLYKETFMFQVALFQLPDVTLMISVYNKRSMKRKEMIGWFSLGYSSSGEEEVSHWNDMRESKGEPVCRWHVLLEA